MTRMRNTLLLTGLLGFLVLSFVVGHAVIPLMANAQSPAKVSYAPITGGDYKIDPAHTTIGFSIRHVEINWVRGRFKDFVGSIHYDEADVTKASVEFTAKVESIDTGVEARDRDLRSPNFFEVAKYPEMTFKSTSTERKGKDSYILHGDFTLKSVTKQIALPFTITGAIKDPRGNTRIGISAQTKIDRRDYGITWGHTLAAGGFDVGNEGTIELNPEAGETQPQTPPH